MSASTSPVAGRYGPGSPWGPPPIPPPRRRRRGLVAVLWSLALLAVVGVVVGAIVVAGPLGDALDEATDSVEDTEDVDDPDERVPVSTMLGGGLTWTMQEEPITEERTTPLPDGSSAVVTMWATETRESAEIVGTFDQHPTGFDVDAGLSGTAEMFGGVATDVVDEIIGGFPARTGTLEGISAGGVEGTGRLTLVVTDTAVVMAMAIGDEDEAEAIHEQHRILVDSLRFN